MRLQEFYESPFRNIRNKKFNLEDFMDEYSGCKGPFTYMDDWVGFNVPGHIVRKFIDTNQPFLKKEGQLISLLIPILSEVDKFYLIGTFNNPAAQNHEVAHALYYLNKEYRLEMDKEIEKLSKTVKKIVSGWLIKQGYCKSVVPDETQAYLATSSAVEIREKFGKRITQAHVEPFRKIFKRYI